MKKVISLLMAALVLLTVVPAVFAAEVTTEDSLVPTFGTYGKYPGKTVDGEYIIYKNSTVTGDCAFAVNIPAKLQNTNATTNYPSARWYKMDFDLNMKVDNEIHFQFRYSFTQNLAYIPNYCDPSTGVIVKSGNTDPKVPVKAGETLHFSFLYDLKDNIRYLFINNLLVTFQKQTSADIGKLMYIKMAPAPTTDTLASDESLDLFSLKNAAGTLYDSNTTIDDMGLNNWMYTETQTETGYSYDVVASWEGYKAFNGETAYATSNGAYVAGFDSEGKLVAISAFQSLDGKTKKFTLTSNDKIDKMKVFVWSRNKTTGDTTSVPIIPAIKAMKVQTFTPETAGFTKVAN